MLYLKGGFVTVYKICTHKLSLADWNPVEKQSNFIVFQKTVFILSFLSCKALNKSLIMKCKYLF